MTQIANPCPEHEIRRLVFARLELHPHRFRAPHEPDSRENEAMKADYYRGLKGFDPGAVEAGMNRIVDEFAPKRWPTVQELREVMIEEQRRLFPPQSRPEPKPCEAVPEQERISPEKMARLKRAIQGDFRE